MNHLRRQCHWMAAAIALFVGAAWSASPAAAQTTNYYYETPSNGVWDTMTSDWATPNSNSTPLTTWGDGATSIANIDNVGLQGRTLTLSGDITAQSLVLYATTLNNITSAAEVDYDIVSNNPGSYNNMTLAGGSIVQDYAPNNLAGTISTEIDANIVAGSMASPTDLTVTATGPFGSKGAASFGDTTLNLTGVNTFNNLHIGGAVAFGGYNTVAIGNAAGLPLAYSGSTQTSGIVYFDGTFSAFAVDSPAAGTPVTLTAGNFVINNKGAYTPGGFVVGIGATAGNTLIINGGIIGASDNNTPALDGIGQGDVQFSTGFSGTLDTDGALSGNGTGLVILNGQSNYAGQTRFNSGISVTTSGTIQSYVRLGINNALPTTTDLIMSYTSGNGGNFDLYGFNQTVGSISTTVLNSPSIIFNSGGASGTTPSTLTIAGSNSPGPFNDAIDDADPYAGVNTSASPGTFAPLTLVRTGTGTTILTNLTSTYSGGTQILGGVLSINDDRELGSSSNPAVPANIIISGGTLAASSSFALSAGRTVAVGAPGSLPGTISVAGASTLTYNGAISDYTTGGPSGTGGLVVTGGGTLSLGGTNTYTGPTMVNQGTLALTSFGSLSSSSNVTVAANGTLAGTGTANGSVAISGTIAPGTASAIGTLNVGSLALNGGGSYTWKLSNATGSAGFGYDTVSVAGALTFNNTQASPFVINAIPIPGSATFDNTQAYSWTIVSAAQAIPSFNSNIFAVSSSLGGIPGSSFSVTGAGTDDLILNYNSGSTQFYQWMKAAGGGSGAWNLADSSWTSGSTTGPWSNTGNGAEFGGTAGTVTLGAPVVAAGLVFQSSGYTIAGSGSNTLTTSSVAVGSGFTETISAPVAGSTLTLSGGGTLVLTSPANSLSGTTTVNAGTLQGNAASLSSNFSVANGTQLVFDQAPGNNGTYSNNLNGSGSVIKRDSGTLTLSGNNSGFTGAFDVTGGTLSISTEAASGANAQLGASVPSVVKIDGGTLQTTTGITSTRTILVGSTGASTGTIDVDGQYVTFEGGTQTSPSATLYNGGTLTITSSAGPGTGSLTILPSASGHGPNTGNTYAVQSAGGDGMIVVDGTSLILGNNTDFTGNFEIMNTAFGGSSTTDNGLTLQNANLTIRAGAQAGASPILQSLNISGNSSITLYRVDTNSSEVALFSQTTAGASTATGNALVNTPLTLNGGSTLTIIPGGNTQNATTNYIGFGSLILNGNATLQVESNQTTGTAGSASPVLYGVDTTIREETGVFNDNGYTTTFQGQLNSVTAFLSVQTTINGVTYGPAGQFGFVTYTSGFDGTKQNSNGYWVISNPAGTQGISVSLQGTNIYDLTNGNVLINPYGQLSLGKAFVYGVPGQTLTVNGLGCTTVSGAIVSPSGTVAAPDATTLRGTIVLGTLTAADAIDATANGSLTLAGNLTGAGLLLKQGGGSLIIEGSNNSATGGTQVGNGTITVGDGEVFLGAQLGTGALSLAQTSTSSTAVVLDNTAQSVGSLSSSFSDTTTGGEAQTIALNGNFAVGTLLTINQTSNTTFGNNGAFANQTSSIDGIGSVVLGAASTGTLTLNGTNTYTGGTAVNGGTLRLDFSAPFAPASNILAPAGALAMGGGTLLVNGATGGSGSSQTVASLAVNPGASAIVDTSNGVNSSLTITAGTINRSAGGTLDFTLPSAGNVTFTTPPTLSGGIIGGWATVAGGSDWATLSGNNVAAYSGATSVSADTALDGGTNYDVTASFNASGAANSLRFVNTSTPATVTLSGTVPITTGGILVPASVTSADAIAGGTLRGASGADLVVIQNSASTMTISSVIADNGTATGLTKSGSGTLALNGANTYSGTTFINAGTLQIDSGAVAGTLGTGPVVNNATLNFDRSDAGLSVANVISGTGAVNEIGGGTTTLTAANTFSGPTTISNGVLQLSNANALQSSTVNIGATNGLTFSPGIGAFTLGGLAGAANVQLQDTASSAPNPVTLQVGNNNASTSYSAVLGGSGGLTKIGTGTLTLSGANTYAGTTAVNGGTLESDFTAPGAPSANILPSGSALSMGGGTLLVNGAASGGGSNQTVASLAVNSGDSAIINTLNSGVPSALTITSPNISRNLGATIDFTPPAGTPSPTNGIVTAAANTNGILGGWATVGGADWATVSGGNIVGLSTVNGYTNDTWAVGANTVVTQVDAPASGSTTNSLLFNSTTSGNSVTLSGTNVITSGGILISSAMTAATTITGGTIEGASGGDLIVIQNGVSNFTLASTIADNGGPTALTKSGPGTLVLGSGSFTSNTFTGNVYINQGTVMLNAGNFYINGFAPTGQILSASNAVNFGSNAAGTIPTLNLNGMNLTVAGLNSNGAAMVHGLSSGFSTGTPSQPTLTIGGAGTYDYAGALADGSGIGPLYLTISGSGTQILSGIDTYSGTTTISAGTLQIGNGGATGSLGSASVADNATLVFDLSSNSTVANPIQGSGSLYQIGSGATTLTAADGYGGGTFVSGGTLATSGQGTIGTGPVNVSGGVLDLSSAAMSVGPVTVGSGGTLNIGLGDLVTSSGAASFAGTLNISGTPSGSSYELIAYSGSPTGMFASATGFPGYALVYASGQLDLQSYSAFNNTSGNTTTVNAGVDFNGGPLPVSGGGSTVINGPVQFDGAAVTVSNGSSLAINGQPTFNSGTVAVNSGTLTINNNTSTPAAGTGNVTITVAPAATVQLAGTASALTSRVNITNNGSTAAGGGLNVTGANQVVGAVSGTATVNGDGTTTYGGDTVVAPSASLTATQILQNTLTIGAGASVVIAPSGPGMSTGDSAQGNSGSGAIASAAAGNAASGASSDASDPLAAIQAAITAGSISSVKGAQLENRLASIEQLATTEPGLDVTFLEDRVLAALPSSSLSPASLSDSLGGADSSLLALDSSGFESSGSAFGASAAFSPVGEIGGTLVGGATAVPEPSGVLLAGLGLFGLAAFALRRRRGHGHQAGIAVG